MDVQLNQREPLNTKQVENDAGGYTWVVDDRKRLQRFLCLGVEGGSYYAGERELALENALCVNRMIENGKGEDVLSEIVDFSLAGRAAKQNPIIFALAMCCRNEKDQDLKKQAYLVLPEVCRIPTHLFLFLEYCEKLSKGTGWGRAHRRAVGNWYLRFKDEPNKLAMHITKYKNRNGWTHKDALRLSHPKSAKMSDAVAAILKYIIKGLDKVKENFSNESTEDVKKTIEFLQAAEDAKTADESKLIALIGEFGLVREHVPTSLLNNVAVWEALLNKMPMTAMMRNLSKMSVVGLLEKNSQAEKLVVSKLANDDALKKARIHPFNVLVTLCTYKSGKGVRGKLKWDVNETIVKALDSAFYRSFKYVEPTNQRYLLAVDVSGSMTCGCVNGSSGINPREASAALAMVTAKTESGNYKVVGFSHELVPLNISPQMDLPTVVQKIEAIPMGGTDCALPMQYATKHNLKFDVFVVYTDCETYFGAVHPAAALREYRKHSGIWNAKLIVCGMTSNQFTIADPEDPGMLDMAGFDSGGPEVMRNFVLGM